MDQNDNFLQRQESLNIQLGGFLGIINTLDDNDILELTSEKIESKNRLKRILNIFKNKKIWFVILMFLGYLIIGGLIFQSLEIINEEKNLLVYKEFIDNIKLNISDQQYEDLFEIGMMRRPNNMYNYWQSLPDAIFYGFTLVSTIGYGYVTPNTHEGKLFSIFYILIGVPLGAYAFGFFAKVILRLFDECMWLNKNPLLKVYKYLNLDINSPLTPSQISLVLENLGTKLTAQELDDLIDDADIDEDGNIDFNELAELMKKRNIHFDRINNAKTQIFYIVILLIIYLIFGMIIFSIVEDWNYLDSIYFSIITITTIGLGDMYPNNNRIIVFIFSCLGLGIMALFIGLICEFTMHNFSYLKFFGKPKYNINSIINANEMKTMFHNQKYVFLYRRRETCWATQLSDKMELRHNSKILKGDIKSWLIHFSNNTFFFLEDENFKKLYEKVKKRDNNNERYRIRINVIALNVKKEYGISHVEQKKNGNTTLNMIPKLDDVIVYDFITDTLFVMSKEMFIKNYELDTRKRLDHTKLKEARAVISKINNQHFS
ncbi:Ion channel [seawater metagenome]|uniref:Ion channel n=1 Tax=seawater metagenome TaxID=1561972 RepID=A0A5E8CKD8_9ZZZZ